MGIKIHFNLLFEAIFYATDRKEVCLDDPIGDFNLLFEAIFYATTAEQYSKLNFIRIFQSSI